LYEPSREGEAALHGLAVTPSHTVRLLSRSFSGSDYTAHLASHGEHENGRQVGRVGVQIQNLITEAVHHMNGYTATEPTDEIQAELSQSAIPAI